VIATSLPRDDEAATVAEIEVEPHGGPRGRRVGAIVRRASPEATGSQLDTSRKSSRIRGETVVGGRGDHSAEPLRLTSDVGGATLVADRVGVLCVAHAYARTRDPRMSGSSATATDARLTRETWHRLVETIVAFATSHVRLRAAALFAGLLALLFAISGLNVVNSYVGRDFMTAIEHRDQSAFVHQAVLYVLVFAALTAVAVLFHFVGSASASSGASG
jgi:hypothetical protein